MCNPAEQASADYSSDPQRNNALVSEIDDLKCTETCARVSAGTSKAIANHSNVTALPMSSAPSKKANGVGGDHLYDTHEHFAEEVPIPLRSSQEIAEELVDQKGGPSKTCFALQPFSEEGDRIDKDGSHVPGFHVKNSSKTSGSICDPNLVESEDNVHPSSAECKKEETKPMETGTLSENMLSKETKSQIEREMFEEAALQETSQELFEDSVNLGGLPDVANEETSLKAVDAQSCPLVSDGSRSAANPAKELSADPCKEAENTETQPDIVHTDRTIEIDDRPALEELGVGSEGHSTGLCSERDYAKAETNLNVKSDANEELSLDFNEPLAWIEMRLKADAAEHAPRSFKEANGEIQSEIEQEDTIASSDSTHCKGSSRPDLAEFFSNARGSKPEKEIEEEECAPVMSRVPLKKQLFMESPRSLRMLLFSEETAQSTKKDEKHKKDGKTVEFASKVAPAKERHSNENRAEHSYPAKWYESSDNEEASNTFSGPMAFSGALTHQGVVSYSGQIQYSGSISHRSDSSTSARSFAFPILASDWNSSPARMGPPDPWVHRRPRRKWHFCCCCCRRASSWFD